LFGLNTSVVGPPAGSLTAVATKKQKRGLLGLAAAVAVIAAWRYRGAKT
jgi:hypothetical protein